MAGRKSLLDALAILIPLNTTLTHHAARHLLCAQFVKDNPTPLES